MTTQLDTVRAEVTDLRMQIRTIASDRIAKTNEANGLTLKVKAGDRRAIAKVRELDAQIDALQAEENQAQRRLDFAMPRLREAEIRSRQVGAYLRKAESDAAAILEITDILKPAGDILNQLARHIRANSGGFTERGLRTGMYTTQDTAAIDRVFSVLSSAHNALQAVERARATAADVGLLEDDTVDERLPDLMLV